MKINKIILTILILSTIVLLFSGCGGGNPVTPPTDTEDSEIPEPTEAVSQKIDLSVGGTIEVTDQESPINCVKLIIPPKTSNKDVKDSIATITISYINDPYSLELPNNRGFLLPPVVINSDVILEVECILEIPYTEADLSNMGLSCNENIKVYRYNYNSSSWEEIPINKRSSRDMSDILEIIFRPEDIDSPYACTFKNADPPPDLGLPQPGDLLYKLSNYKGIEGWLPGHVGIYVGELVYDGVFYYNVIEALLDGVKRTYKNPISAFSGSATYMGARQPKSGALTSKQREDVVWYVEGKVGKPYAIGQSFPGIIFGMLRGNLVKGALGTYNCVGLAEAAYEYAGVNGGQGLVSDWAEGNYCPISLYSSSCVLTPAEQYNKTEPAEGYNEVDCFLGYWINEDPNTGSITKVDIQKSNNLLEIYMWGKCHPTDCDWAAMNNPGGPATTTVDDANDGVLNIVWYPDFAIKTQEITYLGGDRLEVYTFTDFYPDDIYGREDYERYDYFIKGN